MRVLKLLVRVAFICNICFVLAYLILWLPNPPEGQFVSTVIVMGYLMGLPVNAIVLGWQGVLALKRRRRPAVMKGTWGAAAISGWLMFFNLAIFCCQFLLLIQRLK